MEEEVGGSLLNSRRQRDHSREQPKRADVRREQPKFVEDNRISDGQPKSADEERRTNQRQPCAYIGKFSLGEMLRECLVA